MKNINELEASGKSVFFVTNNAFSRKSLLDKM